MWPRSEPIREPRCWTRRIGRTTAPIRSFPEFPPRAHHPHQVKVVSLDAYAARGPCTPALIKVDVEGYEARVLDGATKLLGSNRRPFVVLETADRLADQLGESARSVLRRLEALGYKLYRLDEQFLRVEATTVATAGGELADSGRASGQRQLFRGARGGRTFVSEGKPLVLIVLPDVRPRKVPPRSDRKLPEPDLPRVGTDQRGPRPPPTPRRELSPSTQPDHGRVRGVRHRAN